jgi:very-short-patch-repair endonuclease
MRAKSVPDPGRRAWAIAKRDHDVIARRELLKLGYSSKAIRHRIATGRLHPKAAGVYAVGSPNLTKFGRWMVAVKSCGEQAVLSHLSAAVLWGLWTKEPRQIHVTVPRPRNPRRNGIAVHRRDLNARASTKRHNIPVTTAVQTLIDCAEERTRHETERMINQADARDVLRFDTLRDQVENETAPGAAVLRDILDRETFVLTDSELEQLFVPIARRAGLPKPQTQAYVDGYRVDFYWPDLDLVVEVDGLRYHRTPLEQRRDAERANAHAAADRKCCRFTYWQAANDAAYIERTLRQQARTTGRPRAA